MTPAQKLGLQVGDEVRILNNVHFFFKEGDITELQCDDGSGQPYFKDNSGEYPAGVAMFLVGEEKWEKVEPAGKKSPKKQGIKPYTKRQSVQVGIKGTLADLFDELAGDTFDFNDNGYHYEITDKSTLTVKHKGKEINPKDIKIFIEG